MAKKDFFDVPRTSVKTSQSEVELPILYFDVSVRQLNFWIGYDIAAPKLAGTGLEPTRFFNGKTIVSILLYNYRRTSIGPYEEIAVTITAQPQTDQKRARRLTTFFGIPKISGGISAYVLEMPVTTAVARAGGREIWGYPKFLTNIPFKLSKDDFEFSAPDPASGESIIKVKADTRRGVNTKGFDLITYSNLNNEILKTTINVDAKYRASLNRPAEIKIGPAKHRMADNLRDLGIDVAQPFFTLSCETFHSRLNKGEPVAPWKTPALPYPVN